MASDYRTVTFCTSLLAVVRLPGSSVFLVSYFSGRFAECKRLVEEECTNHEPLVACTTKVCTMTPNIFSTIIVVFSVT
jgi:hypothetical protein